MEIVGIILSIPLALVASLFYCLFLVKIVSRSERARYRMRFASLVVLGLFAAECVLLATLGAVRSRAVLGPGFYPAHLLSFFLTTPALANLLVFRSRAGVFLQGYVATVLCTVFAFFLVLLQYDVSESLYRQDGNNGPYSSLSSKQSTRRVAS